MERLMQYVWNNRLWPAAATVTTDGRRIQIIDPGQLNTDSGPDFFNAKIRIGGEMWVGNVEMHVRASDWHRHGHDNDPAYDNVILHVVDISDTHIPGADGRDIPQMVMQCSPNLNRDYTSLVGAAGYDLGCREILQSVDRLHVRMWTDALFFERLHQKADRIAAYREAFTGDWEQAAFVAIARALGSGVNGEIFERLAMSLPLRLAGRHNDSLEMTEALVFGQSGMLETAPANGYTDSLRREYRFLATKFGLTVPQGMLWKMARMRPASLPFRRLALLASMLHVSTRFMSRILAASADEDDPVEALSRLFTLPLSAHWTGNYTFEDTAATNPGGKAVPVLGEAMLRSIIINAVVPLIYAYGVEHGDATLEERAVDLVNSLPPERNTIVRLFTDAGLPCDNAADSQALIQLRRAYCEQRKCLYCRYGHRWLSRKTPRSLSV
ncbi:MAG: DUF2851 family protein [Clostridium sp.]|nr:DUF2851 family protein [Clostridium sp.]